MPESPAVTSPIPPWQRRGYRPTGQDADVLLIVLSGDVPAEPRLPVEVPPGAPVGALERQRHAGAEGRAWANQWRTGAFRDLAAAQLGELGALDAAAGGYAVRVRLADPADLSHLQLAWATATQLAAVTTTVVFDVLAGIWHPGGAVAAQAPERPFSITREISVVYERQPTPAFGHPVHTRGMTKFARPDLIAGVSASQIPGTARILNHLAAMLADGAVLTPGQRLRFDGRRTLRVERYEPGDRVPDVHLAADGLLLVDV